MREAGLFAKAKKESATLFRVSATVRAKRVGNFARVRWPTASGCQRASPASTATMRASASFPTRIAGSAPQGRAHLAQPRLAWPAGGDHDLLRVRVLADVDVDQRRQRQIAHGHRAGVDDLVRHL